MDQEPILRACVGGAVSTNGYLLRNGSDYFVIDAPKGMFDYVKSCGVKPVALLLTHQHYDHVEDAAKFSKDGIPIYAYQEYSPPLVMEELAKRWGLDIKVEPFEVTNVLKGKEIISVGNASICVFHVPGHSPDSVVFYFSGKQFLFCGDTLFEGSVGRSDLPFGDHKVLIDGINKHLMKLEDNIEVSPGHGDMTTIGHERRTNPFLKVR